jgi:hypothetical protein
MTPKQVLMPWGLPDPEKPAVFVPEPSAVQETLPQVMEEMNNARCRLELVFPTMADKLGTLMNRIDRTAKAYWRSRETSRRRRATR